jgi:hypothetical protein
MGPFILFGLLFYLALIVASVAAYPFICTLIVSACKKYYWIVTSVLLLLTMALYSFACTILEDFFGNWCYSVYAGLVLTPIVLYFYTLEEQEDGYSPQSVKLVIPILTIITSSLFAIEGGLRMAHSYSIHRLLNCGWGNQEADNYRLYYEELHSAGSLLFFVSLFSTLILGYCINIFFEKCREKRAYQAYRKAEKDKIAQKVKADSDLLMSFESQQVDEAIQYYNTFCQKLIAALGSSNEKYIYSLNGTFNSLETSYKVLSISKGIYIYHFYPMGIVYRNNQGTYEYIPYEGAFVSLKTEHITKTEALPEDVLPIRQSWRYSRLDGGPDLRYGYNPKTYVYEYGILRVLHLDLHVFRMNAAKDVVSAYNKMYSYISQLKLQKQHIKMNVLPEEKAGIITENKEGITEANQLEDNKKAKQQVSIDNPKTLEECFIVIIRKHGIDIIKDSNLVSIVSSYIEVDISDYKNIFDGMVDDNFLNQFIDPKKQNDFTLFNLSTSYARQKKVNVQGVLFITQALVNAIKKVKNNLFALAN